MIGIESLFPLPQGWTLHVVDDIKATEPNACVAGPFGSEISSKYFVEEGIPVIRGSNLRDDLTRFVPEGFVFVSEERSRKYVPQHVKGGDLIFTCWGTIGQVGLIPEDGPFPEYIISNKQLKRRVNQELAKPLFCFYYLASPAGVQYIRNRGIGGAVPGINLGILKSLPIALTPLDVQQNIVDVLAAYDDLLENNRRRMTLLEGLASGRAASKFTIAVTGAHGWYLTREKQVVRPRFPALFYRAQLGSDARIAHRYGRVSEAE
jgi:type I restriction enzyme S subunit